MDITGALARVYRYIWSYDACDLNQPRFRGRHYLQILLMVVRDLFEGMISLRAMSLVFTTILSIVPLLAISLVLLKGFGFRDQLEPTLINLLLPLGESGAILVSRIMDFVANVKIGVLGTLGSLILLFTVLSLIHKVEMALNYTWRLRDSGSLKQRIINYLSVFLVVPVMMVTAAVITASSSSEIFLNLVTAIPYLETLVELGGKLTPYVLIVGAFIYIYLVVPNTRVNFRSALFGALIAGGLWKISAVLFGWFIDYSTNYTVIYSGFAIVFMLIIWIYLGWTIVLTGSSFVYYHQYPQRLRWRRQAAGLGSRSRAQIALQLMIDIARSSTPVTLDDLAKRQRLPVEIVARVIDRLKADQLIVSSDGLAACYMPADNLDSIRLIEIIRSARRMQDIGQGNSLYCEPAVTTLLGKIDAASESCLGDSSLADIINEIPEQPCNEDSVI